MVASSARAACLEALQAAEALTATGQHAEALRTIAACVQLLPAVEGDATLRPAAARLHALQARCQAQLGCLKQAAASYTAAIRLLQQPSAQQGRQAGGQQAEEEAEESQQAQLGQLLVARSAAHEQVRGITRRCLGD